MDYTKINTCCFICNQKIKLVNLHSSFCKCNLNFCSMHLPNDKHNCTFDYKKENAVNLLKNNPVILSKKI